MILFQVGWYCFKLDVKIAKICGACYNRSWVCCNFDGRKKVGVTTKCLTKIGIDKFGEHL